MTRWMSWMALGLCVGCNGQTAADLAACQDSLKTCFESSETAPGMSDILLTAYEAEVLGALLDDVKKGVRPYGENSIGLCLKSADPDKSHECGAPPVQNPGELAPGEYFLFGEWSVPDVGPRGTWTLKLETECITKRLNEAGEETSSRRTTNKEFQPVYTGPKRGYPTRMRRVTSPSSHGRVECTYKITNAHGDGDKVYEGAWIVPEAEAEKTE